MVVAIATQKGGVGKTSTTLSLSSGLAHKGKRVLLIDLDPQAHSAKVLIDDYGSVVNEENSINATIIYKEPIPFHPTKVNNLYLSPSHILLSNSDIELTIAKDHREERLKTQLDKIKNDFDYVFIDCPPNLGWLTLNALTAADKVVVVIAPGYFELDSVVQFNKTLKEVREYFNPNIQLSGYLFTMADPTVNSRTSLKILRQTYTENVFNTIIPRNTDLRDAHFNKLDIFTYNKSSKAAMAYNSLLKEAFNE